MIAVSAFFFFFKVNGRITPTKNESRFKSIGYSLMTNPDAKSQSYCRVIFSKEVVSIKETINERYRNETTKLKLLEKNYFNFGTINTLETLFDY